MFLFVNRTLTRLNTAACTISHALYGRKTNCNVICRKDAFSPHMAGLYLFEVIALKALMQYSL